MTSFPWEALILLFYVGAELVFKTQRSALDWAFSFLLLATAIRWLRQWRVEKGRR